MDIGLISVIVFAAVKFMALAAVGVLVYLLGRIHQLRERKRLETTRPMPADAGSVASKAAPGPAAVGMGNVAGMGGMGETRPAARPLPAGPMPLDDVAGRLLDAYPGQIDALLKFLGWVGILGAALISVITVILGMIPGALRLWAIAMPDPEEDHTLWGDSYYDHSHYDDSYYFPRRRRR